MPAFLLNPFFLRIMAVAVIAVAVYAAIVGVYMRGYNAAMAEAQARIDARDLQYAQKLVEWGKKDSEYQAQLAQALARKTEVIRTVTKTITREVPVYVSPDADSRCDVPVGFVRIHDGAAAGVPPSPDPAGRAADAPAGVALSAVASTVADNYGACNEALAKLAAWQTWYEGVRKEWEK